MQKKTLLEEMAKIVSEIQTINLWIEDARTNRIARIRYHNTSKDLATSAGGTKDLQNGQ